MKLQDTTKRYKDTTGHYKDTTIFYFAILSQLVKKVRMDFFDKLQRPQPSAAGAVKC